MTIINGTFDTDLTGWTITPVTGQDGDVIQDAGRMRLRIYKCSTISVEQTFTIDNIGIYFEWDTMADYYANIPAFKLVLDDGTVIIDKILLTLGWGTHATGTTVIDVPNYIGRTATLTFYMIAGTICSNPWNSANTYLWIDNIATGSYLVDANVAIDPSGARIYVDNVIDTGIDSQGIGVPVAMQVSPGLGKRTFTFRKAGYFAYMRTENMVVGNVTNISGIMKRVVSGPPCT